MVCTVDNKIVNLSRFKSDISPLFNNRGIQKVVIDTPMVHNTVTNNIKDFENLVKEITNLANNLPHRRCALIYKMDQNSSLCLEIHPITDAA